MRATRIDGFVGDDRAYAGYLCEVVSGLPLLECIQQLEQLVTLRRRQHRAPHSPNAELDDSVQAADRVPNLRSIQSVLGKPHPTPPPGLNIVMWDPTEQSLSSSRSSSPVWIKRTATFFNNLPRSEDQWREKRENLGLSDAHGILSAVGCLTTGRLGNDSGFTDHTAKPDLQDALEAFAANAGSYIASTRRNLQLSRFLSLILIATLCVAIHEGHPVHLVDAAQRKFLAASRRNGKCEEGAEQLHMDRLSVRWLLQEMQRQFRRGLRHRAFELFLLEGGDIHFYKYCPKETKENQIFTQKIPCCDVPDEIQACLPFWPPFLVQMNVSGRWSYSTTCKALSVDLLNQEEDFQHFQDTINSKKLVACQLGDMYAAPNAHVDGSTSTTTFRPINPGPHGRDGPTTSSPPTKRRKMDRGADGLSRGGAGRVSAAQEAPFLALLADVAGQERAERLFTGAVPISVSAEQTSSTSFRGLSPRDAESAASTPQSDPSHGRDTASMERRFVSGCFNASGLVTCPDGSSFPIRNLGETRGGISTETQEALNGVALATMPPECQNLMASPLDLLSDAAGQAERLDQVAALPDDLTEPASTDVDLGDTARTEGSGFVAESVPAGLRRNSLARNISTSVTFRSGCHSIATLISMRLPFLLSTNILSITLGIVTPDFSNGNDNQQKPDLAAHENERAVLG
ncbi:uncharacterized protein B0T15DRAFT_253506 [Chaetomium strumarium]|uniref:Uncharacterized protein n=1 Tax=Chaetomium strumarium TaxID=1170767 RepID=A0AAJ0M0U1_9PEZI|nr:hypothetical protein B0T15DRAFT_253506 [Chaetomium strumarium]